MYWDICTASALIFTAIVTPYEVCVGLETELNALYMVNTLINAISL